MIDKKLSALAKNIINANGALMAAVLDTLPDDSKRQLSAILENGGQVGFECSVNAQAVNRILLVGITEPGKKRVVIAEVGSAALHTSAAPVQ